MKMIAMLPRQKGLSIVELMVALLLSSLLTVGLVQIFTSNSQTFRLNEASARVQESGRMASEILSRAIRNADYWGCSRPMGEAGTVKSMLREGRGFNAEEFLSGLMGEHDVDETNDYSALAGSDVIIFGGVDTNASLSVNQRIPRNAARLFMEDPRDLFESGDIILISDCRQAEMMQATQVHNNGIVANTGSGTPGNETKEQSPYDPGATVVRPSRSSFFVRAMDDGNRALVFSPMHTQSSLGTPGNWGDFVELVNDIWDMRIEFGRDTDGDGRVNIWSVPGPKSEADQAIAVRFSLLVRSPQDNVLEEAQTYCFPGWGACDDAATGLVTAGDRHLYRVYAKTTSIRNRLRN